MMNRQTIKAIFVSSVLTFLLAAYGAANNEVSEWKTKQTSIDAPVILPPRASGEVLVTWGVLVNQFDRSKPQCDPLRKAAEKVANSELLRLPLITNIEDMPLIYFKVKARRAGCLILDKGEVY